MYMQPSIKVHNVEKWSEKPLCAGSRINGEHPGYDEDDPFAGKEFEFEDEEYHLYAFNIWEKDKLEDIE